MAVFRVGGKRGPTGEMPDPPKEYPEPSVAPKPPGPVPWRAYGRPTVLTPELIVAFCAEIQEVLYIETAAALLCLAPQTVRNWLRWGRAELVHQENGEPPDPTKLIYLDFWISVQAARAMKARRHLGQIDAAGDRYWNAAAWLLERGYPALWGDHSKDVAELKRMVSHLEKVVADGNAGGGVGGAPVPAGPVSGPVGDGAAEAPADPAAD